MDQSGEFYASEAAGIDIHRQVFAPDSDAIQGGALILHGLGDHLGCHLAAAELFCGRDLLCVGIDWPGHGLSGGKRGDIEGIAVISALIAESRAHLESLLPTGKPLGMYAHSTGAFFALEYLTQQGQAADSPLLDWTWLSSPLLRPEYGQHPVKKMVVPLVAKLAPHAVFDTGVRSDRCRHINESGEEGEDKIVAELCHHFVSARLGADLLAHAGNIPDQAAAIRDPMRLLITQGSDDNICPTAFSREFFERVPAQDKTYALLPGMLHEPLREPDNTPLVEAVEDWFDSWA